MNMQINYVSYNTSYNSPAFGAKGCPISLRYIVDKRSYYLPERVLRYARELIARGEDTGVSLLDIHKKIYEPILECKTLAEVKRLFPEFDKVLPVVPCQKRSINLKSRQTENFGLKVLQDYWGNLMTKDEIAKMLGMPSRGTLDFSLNKINFAGYHHNYRTLLKASDTAGNKNIADKTKAWNKANPELRQTLNKHAAQFCKKEEYRQAQAQRMFEYDMLHPERRQKISQKSKEMWNRCPEVKTAMCQFSKKQGQYLSILLAKHAKKLPLSETEQIVLNSFFKKFWMAHPEMKKILADALSDVINEMA